MITIKTRINLVLSAHLGLVLLQILLLAFTYRYPLLGTLGFESANLFVTTLGPFFCLVAAINRKTSFPQIFLFEFKWLLLHLSLHVGLLAVNGVYLTSCSQGSGLVPFLIIAAPPLLLNQSLGSLLASLLSNIALKIVTVFLGYLAYGGAIFLWWWKETGFRILTHASIVVTSDLVEGGELNPALIAYRLATLFLASAVILVGMNFLGQKPDVFRPNTRHPYIGLGLIALTLVSYGYLNLASQQAIGKNHQDLLRDYIVLGDEDDIRVHANPNITSKEQAAVILTEARYYRHKLKSQLAISSLPPITIWLHHSDGEKFLYTGAKNVHFALPKHREIHISGYETPHPVLGHEIAHIYVGAISDNIFGYPGTAILPSLGLTEGLAVALTKELSQSNGLSIFEQAQAIYQNDPKIDFVELFSTNPTYFASLNPSVSYILAGAFIDFFLRSEAEMDRAELIKAMIKSGDIKSLAKTENDFARKSQALVSELLAPVRKDALYWAERRFRAKSILVSDCSEEARAEQIKFNQALLNQDAKTAEALLANFSVNKQRSLLKAAIAHQLSLGHFTLTLDLIKIYNDAGFSENKAEEEDLKLTKIDALVNANKYHEAEHVLASIDEDYLSPAQKRLVVVLRVFFHDLAAGGQEHTLPSLALLFAKANDQDARLSNFSYHLGQSLLRPASIHYESRLLSQYILARFFMRQNHYHDAKLVMSTFIDKAHNLADIIEKETRLMWAITLANLGEDREAATQFKALLEKETTAFDTIFINDQIERLQFKNQ